MNDQDLATASEPSPEAMGGTGVSVLDRNPRLAASAFLVIVVVAVPLYLWAGRDQWFFLDEWDFLAGRELGSVSDLLRPHNEHWSTIPIVLYRAVWNVVGLNAYWPYQLLAIVNHVAIAALLRVVMRRAGVGPWIATISAVAFLLFGAGAQNIVWGFQVQFAGPLTFGLLQLIASDHDGGIDRRDWLGLLAGLAAIMSSGVGVVMVVAVGVAAWPRRGWRAALFHTAPLAVVYAMWWLAYGRDGMGSVHSTASQTWGFVVDAYRATFRSLGVAPAVGVLLGVVLVGGLALAWREWGERGQRRLLSAPVGLLVGGALFVVVTGWGRAYLRAGSGETSRYLHVLAAMTLPAIAVGVEAVYRRWRAVGMAAAAVVLVGVPGNVLTQSEYRSDYRLLLGNEGLVLALPSVPLGVDAPASLRPLSTGPDVTMGWLRAGRDSGRVPEPGPIDPSTRQRAEWMLTFWQTDDATGADDTRCEPLVEPTRRDLAAGDVIHLQSGVLQIANLDRPALTPVGFIADGGRTIEVRAPVRAELRPAPGWEPTVLCA